MQITSLRIISSLFVLLTFAIQSMAQISVGINGGYTKAKEYYGDVFLPPNAETSVHCFNIHATGYYHFNSYISIGAEPGYAGRGAACVPGFLFPVFDTKFYLNYAELPVLLKGSLPLFNNHLALFGKAGIGTSFLVSAFREDEDLFGDLPTTRTKMPLDETGILNRWDFGAYAGTGIGYNFSGSQIYFAFDYYYGLVDAEKNNTSKNRCFNLGVGYSYFLTFHP